MKYVVGVDAGGTASRALAVADDGTVLGTGRAGGGNPNSHPPGEAAASVAAAISGALADLDPAGLRGCVVGMAGTSKLTDRAIAATYERAWVRAGLGSPPRLVTDAEAAFASATAAPDGTVLVAGTGSIAGRIRERRMVSMTGGYGWLLGDEGSGYWIGREAVRATLDALFAAAPLGPLGPLARAVLAEAGVDRAAHNPGHLLITAANGESPVRLARFAPLVSTACDDGDPVARRIVEDAARELTRIASAARDPGERTPVVLAGSVLGDGSPVGALVTTSLGDLPVLHSADGVLGAAWLAAVDAFGEDTPRPEAVP